MTATSRILSVVFYEDEPARARKACRHCFSSVTRRCASTLQTLITRAFWVPIRTTGLRLGVITVQNTFLWSSA